MGYKTPNIDRLALEGMRYTNFYAAQPISGASRAGLLTGCYPNRIGFAHAPNPGCPYGISDEEETIAEVLKKRDYATAIFGKWHLGDAPVQLHHHVAVKPLFAFALEFVRDGQRHVRHRVGQIEEEGALPVLADELHAPLGVVRGERGLVEVVAQYLVAFVGRQVGELPFGVVGPHVVRVGQSVPLVEPVLQRQELLGVACADTFMAMAALFFYSMLQTQIEQYNTLLRVIGGIFVVIVGVYIFAQNPVPQIRRNRAGKTSLWQDFASIFGLTIANFIMVIPYILAFFAVFKISGGDITHEGVGGFIRAAFIIAGFFGGAAAWWTMLAFVINLFRRRFRPRHMLTINHVAGLIIGILGIYTILSTFLDIFPKVGY